MIIPSGGAKSSSQRLGASVRTVRIGLITVIFAGVAVIHAASLRAAAITVADELPSGFFLPPGQTPGANTEKPPPQISRAVENFKGGRYDECLQQLEAASGKHPGLLPPRLILAKLFLASRQIAQGRIALEQAIAKHPDRPEIYLQFAALALADGHLTDAALQFEKALSLVPAEAGTTPQRQFLSECHAGLATVAERRGQWSAAQKQVGLWLKADPQSGPAHERLARAMIAQDRPKEAYQALQRAAELATSPRPPELAMAILLTQFGKADQAEPWIVRLAEQSPEDALSRLAIATWYLEQGQLEKAKQHADTTARLAPKAKDLALLRGTIARHLREYEQAETYFQEQYTAFPADFRASNGLALVLIEQAEPGKRLRALQLAEINARQYPRMSEALATLGWLYYKFDRLDEAEKALKAATAGGQSSSDTAYYLASVLARRGLHKQVATLLQSAVATPGTFVFRDEARRWLTELTTEESATGKP